MRRKTNQEYLEQHHQRWGDEYTLLTPYQSQARKVKVKHNVCGNVYLVYPMNLVRGHACKFCQNRSLKPTELFKNQMFELFGNRYSVLEPYRGANRKIKFKCNKCNHILYRTPSSFINSRKECGYCSNRIGRFNAMKARVNDEVGNDYKFLDYVPSHHNDRREFELVLQHKKCGIVFRVTPFHFFSEKTRCPHCRESHGEIMIASWLSEHHISFVSQKTFKECSNKALLPFDFYLPSRNMCIEYDGEQHYGPDNFYNKKRGFEYRQRNDRIKTNFCHKNDIKLIRIRYDENIDNILRQVL